MKTKILISILVLSLLVLPLVYSKDVAYVVKSSINAESNVISSIDELGYSYDIIEESDITNTNFSEYRMMLIGDSAFSLIYKEKLKDLMINYNTLVLNSKYYYKSGLDYQWGWSLNKGTISSPSKLRNNIDLDTPIDNNVDVIFNAYSVASPDVLAYVLTGQKPNGIKIVTYKEGGTIADSVLAYAEPGVKLLNGKTLNARGLFFGVTNSQYWTENTRTLFKNSLMWTIQYPTADFDSDGYCKAGYLIINATAQCANETGNIGTDCNDGNSSINPDGIEIPYNGIDENCDGYDVADVDLDGYCQYGYIINNKDLQCANETGNVGTDCNDNDVNISPGSSDLTKNCKNDGAVQLDDIEDQSWEEDSSKLIDISSYFSDPEENALTFEVSSVSDSNVIVENLGNGLFNLSSEENWDGEATIIFVVKDMFNVETESNEVLITVNPENDAPIQLADIENQSWEEDSSKLIDISSYFSDPEENALTFEVSSVSDSNVIVKNLGNGLFNLSSEENWYGDAIVIFSVRDIENLIISNTVNLIVLSVNDAPVQLADIEDQIWEEDSSKLIDISTYFSDPEGDALTFEVSSVSDSNVIVENLGNGLFNLSSEENWDGEATIIFEISDGTDSISSNEIEVFVGAVNHNPLLEEIENKYYFSGQLISIIPSATDVDGDTIVYSYSTPLNSSGQWQTNIGDEGSYRINVEARDGVGGVDIKSFFIYVMPRALINEISVSPKWVEIYNKNSMEINLNECYLENKNSERLNLSGIITGNSFASFNWDNLSDDWDRIKLVCMDEIIDEAGYGNGMLIPYAGQSVGRIPDGDDTNQDSDFKILGVSTRDLPNSADMVIPIVTLTNPQNEETFTTREINFGFEAIDNSDSLICELYSNTGGVFGLISSKVISLISGSGSGSILLENITDGSYIWNIKCSDSRNTVFSQNNRTFTVNAPDAPIFNAISDKSISENQTLSFTVSATDADNENLTYTAENMPVGATFLEQLFSWTPNFNQSGSYSVKFKAVDSTGLSATKTVKINVANVKIPLAFTDVKCENKSSKIEIKINDPKSGDDFEIGENITVDIKIKNNLNETLKGNVYAHLYNIDEDKSITDEKEKVSLKKGESENYEIELQIPEDIDDSDKFAIVVIVEDDVCNSEYAEISLERADNSLLIDKFYINPSPAEIGENVDFNIRVKNIGTEEQEGLRVKIENSDINLSLTTESFDLEEYDEDDTATKKIEWDVPEDIEDGSYTIKASISYEGKTVTKEATLRIENSVAVIVTGNESTATLVTTPVQEGELITIEYNPDSSSSYTHERYDKEILSIYSENTEAKTVDVRKEYNKLPDYLNQPIVSLLLKVLSVLLGLGIIVFFVVIAQIYRSKYY